MKRQAYNLWLEILNSYEFLFRFLSRVLRADHVKMKNFLVVYFSPSSLEEKVEFNQLLLLSEELRHLYQNKYVCVL